MLKSRMKFPLIPILFCFSISSGAQNASFIPVLMDVVQYDFGLTLTDTSDQLSGIAGILLKKKIAVPEIALDLTNRNPTGKGMTVTGVWCQGRQAIYKHEGNKLIIVTPTDLSLDSLLQIRIAYSGIPADGLIISTNKYGHRTFFGDNWPNRAHNWLPCNDHPSDKAPVNFRVTAPDHYQVVSNGIQTERTNNGNGTTTTEWTETTPIPTKTMVIGLAEFAVRFAGTAGNVPVFSWVFPEDRLKGFYDYEQATAILPFFTERVGTYPFAKLANVQSKTIFGGMENAGCIFYYENSVNGQRKEEALLTHEIAHQWFGNSATEVSWQHLWLSEGFATYMTNLYLENKYGPDTLAALLKVQRKAIIEFSVSAPQRPVIDSLETNLMKLLNANSYQKGGWFLHQLRRKIGDDFFWMSVRNYYSTFACKNASTEDFMKICEATSHQPLEQFFHQWLRQPGQPKLDIQFRNKKNGITEVSVTQLQKTPFSFSLDILCNTGKGSSLRQFDITGTNNWFTISTVAPVTSMVIDPNTNLLADWIVKRVK